jgi:hypothetical protein
MIDIAGLQADLLEAIADLPESVVIQHATGGVSAISAGVSDLTEQGRLIETEGEVMTIDLSVTFVASALSEPVETGDEITRGGKIYTAVRITKDRAGVSITADCKEVV